MTVEPPFVEHETGQDNEFEPLPPEPEDQAPEDVASDDLTEDDLAPQGSE